MAIPSDRHPLPAGSLEALRDAVLPSGRVGRVRRMRGGVSSAIHAVDLLGPDGEPLRLVVRRYGPWRLKHDPDVAVREWQTLELLSHVGVPAPLPVWRDDRGVMFGGPALVVTRLPGRGQIAPRDLEGYVGQLARTLAAIHAAPGPDDDLSFLADQRIRLDQAIVKGPEPEHIAGYPEGEMVWTALREWWPKLEPAAAPTLLHGDYWPGNTMWTRGRLSAVVDWEQPLRGDPGQDVGCGRLDLALLFGPEAPDMFLRAYEQASGRHIPHLFFWDLHATSWALPVPHHWLPAYHGLGRTDITPEILRDRFHAFVLDALGRAGQ
jgi:aminoglycoside phosphotransferase (APT) family kinase protein